MEQPKVKTAEWISIGKGHIPAVVCAILEEKGQVEVVYIDIKGKAINEEVRWIGNCWEFVLQGPNGGYADTNSRLKVFVNILRAGPHFK